jgi:hypothetical protein
VIIGKVHIGRAFEYYSEAMAVATLEEQCAIANVDAADCITLIDAILEATPDDPEAGTLLAFFMGILCQREAERDSGDGDKDA